MPARVDLYDSAYENYELDLYAKIRVATYGEDLGQTSWVTTQESNEIPNLLQIGASAKVLEVGCGSGRYALRLAEKIRCHIVGLDLNAYGIRNANELAHRSDLHSWVRFEEGDASKKLLFNSEIFDAVFSNDVLCHIPGRAAVLAELSRVLKPGGRLLFSDALVIGGLITNEELAARSSIGFYVFTPPELNGKLIDAAGLRLVHAVDTTENAALIAKRWHDARQERSDELITLEGPVNFEGLQRFLSCAHTLTREKRLLRWLYVAQKDADPLSPAE